MRRALHAPPEDFTLSPLLPLLPAVGSASRLEALTSSLFARFEKVTGLLKDSPQGLNPESKRSFQAEADMLRQVLDWLEVKPGGE